MTDEERSELQTRYADAVARAASAYKEAETLRNLLKDGCAHPAEFVEEYKWEHDNGYGRQTMITGKRCKLCFATNNWGSKHWVPLRHQDY